MASKNKTKISASEKPSETNNYLFEARVKRVQEKRACSLEEAEKIVSEIIQKDHPDWNPPTVQGTTLEEIAGAVASAPTEEATDLTEDVKPAKKTKKVKAEEGGDWLTTKDLAEHYGVTTVALRRVLRGMKRYDDGVFTRYKWNGWDDPEIKLIDKEFEEAEAQKE